MSLRCIQRARPSARALGLAGAFTLSATLGALVLALGTADGASAAPGGNGNGAAASAGSSAGGNGNGAAASAGSNAGGASASAGGNGAGAGGGGAAVGGGAGGAGGGAGAGAGGPGAVAGGAGGSGGAGGGSVASGGGTQGASGSNPDGGGVDKPYPAAGQPAMSQGQSDFDGNNGCGNDNDRSDDNLGGCGRKRGHFMDKPEEPVTTTTPPTTVLEVTPTTVPVITEKVTSDSVVITESQPVIPTIPTITYFSENISETESVVRTITEFRSATAALASTVAEPIAESVAAPIAPVLVTPAAAETVVRTEGARVLAASTASVAAPSAGTVLAATVDQQFSPAAPARLPVRPVRVAAAGELAYTGTPVRGLLEMGITLILLGLVSLLAARPRRRGFVL